MRFFLPETFPWRVAAPRSSVGYKTSLNTVPGLGVLAVTSAGPKNLPSLKPVRPSEISPS